MHLNVRLKEKSNSSLLEDLKFLVGEERRILSQVLHHLRQVEKRSLHLEMGYPNLYSFCTQELSYSEASAYRRISAMRMIKEIPEVEQKIQEGSLSLSVVSQVQTHFRSLSYDVEAKKEILRELENKTSKEIKRFLLNLSPQQLPQEKLRAVDQQHTEIRILFDQLALAKLKQVQSRLSHQNLSISEIFEKALDLLIERKCVSKRKVTKKNLTKVNFPKIQTVNSSAALECNTVEKTNVKADMTQNNDFGKVEKNNASVPPMRRSEAQKFHSTSRHSPCSANSNSRSQRYIPRFIKDQVYQRDHGSCQYKDHRTGKICGSKFYLQYDHIRPLALGGLTEIENLRLLCCNHNKLMWQRNFQIQITGDQMM